MFSKLFNQQHNFSIVKPVEFPKYPALEDISERDLNLVNKLCHACTELCIIFQELLKEEIHFEVERVNFLELVAFIESNISSALVKHKIPDQIRTAFYYSLRDSFIDQENKIKQKGWNALDNFFLTRNVYKNLTYAATVDKNYYAMTAIFHLLLREPLLYKDTLHYLKVPSSIEDANDVRRFFRRVFFEIFIPNFTEGIEKILMEY